MEILLQASAMLCVEFGWALTRTKALALPLIYLTFQATWDAYWILCYQKGFQIHHMNFTQVTLSAGNNHIPMYELPNSISQKTTKLISMFLSANSKVRLDAEKALAYLESIAFKNTN